MDPTLQKQKSTVPVSCQEIQSTVLNYPISKAWEFFKGLKLESIMPNTVKSTQWVIGGAGQVDSTLKVVYADGAVWDLLITDISNNETSIGYSILSTEPAHSVTSMQGKI